VKTRRKPSARPEVVRQVADAEAEYDDDHRAYDTNVGAVTPLLLFCATYRLCLYAAAGRRRCCRNITRGYGVMLTTDDADNSVVGEEFIELICCFGELIAI